MQYPLGYYLVLVLSSSANVDIFKCQFHLTSGVDRFIVKLGLQLLLDFGKAGVRPELWGVETGVGDVAHSPELEEPRAVVQRREQQDREDVEPGLDVVAKSEERGAHCDVSI